MVQLKADQAGKMRQSPSAQGNMCLWEFAAICCLLILGPAAAQFGGFGGPAAKEAAPAVKSDLPYIRCGACEALAKNAYRQIKALKDAQKHGKKVRCRISQESAV